MKSILFNPPSYRTEEDYHVVTNAPVSACMMTGYAASLLKKNGFTARVIDANRGIYRDEKLIRDIKNSSINLLSVYLLYSKDSAKVFDLLKKIKTGDLHISLFGYYPSFSYEEILNRHNFIDSIICGEPEYTMLELAGHLSKGEEWRGIKEIAYRDGEKIIKGEKRTVIENLDALPFPYRYEDNLDKFAYILGSRGCYNNCAFCYINGLYDMPIRRTRSITNIIEEMEYLIKNHHSKYFYFADANFFDKDEDGKLIAKNFANLVMERLGGISFGIECRADDVDKDTLIRLKASGLRDIFIGIESGSDEALSEFNKNIRADKNRESIAIVRELGLNLHAGFIMFEPFSTLSKIKENLLFLKDTGLLYQPVNTAYLLSQKIMVYRGTKYYKLLNDSNSDNYEIEYSFKYEEVEILYNLIKNISFIVLRFLDNIYKKQNNYYDYAAINDTDFLKIADEIENIEVNDILKDALSKMTKEIKKAYHIMDREEWLNHLLIQSFERGLNILNCKNLTTDCTDNLKIKRR